MSELFTIKPLGGWILTEEEFTQRYESRVGSLFNASVYRTRPLLKYTYPRTPEHYGPWTPWRLVITGGSNYLPCESPEQGKRLAEQHWQEYLRAGLVEVGHET